MNKNNQISDSIFKTTNIFGINFVQNFEFQTLYNYIKKNTGITIAFSNLNSIYNALINENFLKIINSFDLIVPDGSSVSLMNFLLNRNQLKRYPGPDFFETFLKYDSKFTHFFIGSTNNTLEKIVNKAKMINPNLKIVGYYSPPFEKSFSKKTNLKIIEQVLKASPDILWVSFGCPKQEKWIIKNRNFLKKVKLIAGVGAAFDYYSGNLIRPPKIIRKLGLEFLFRFFQQPKKSFKRVFIEPFFVFKYLTKQIIKK